ncbi:MAG: hypothetical protein IJ589_00690, partial [Lachnospiraceae bacterium]|nr:hypothetical protein [Lachnospiraceae bacterium]
MLGHIKKSTIPYLLVLLAELFILVSVVLKMNGTEALIAHIPTDMFTCTEVTESGMSFESAVFPVSVGVLRIRAELSGEAWVSGVINVSDIEETQYKRISMSSIYIAPEQKSAVFEVYVEQPTYAKVVFSQIGGQKPLIDNLAVFMTPLRARMKAVILLCVFGLLDLLILIRIRIKEGKTKVSDLVIPAILAGSVVLMSVPLFTDYIFLGADGDVHYLRMESLYRTLRSGAGFPVRIDAYCLYDHGYAFSVFYPDLFLLFPVLLRFCGFSILFSFKAYVFAANLAAIVIAYYAFGLCTKEKYAALLGAVLYAWNPYRLYNVYGRMALGEYTAMTFFPLVIAAVYLLLTRDQEKKEYAKYKFLLIAGMSGIIESHVLSTVMITVFLVVVCLANIRAFLRKKCVIQVAEAIVITALLNLYTLYPLAHMIIGDAYVYENVLQESIQGKGTSPAAAFQFVPYRGGAQVRMYNAEPDQIGTVNMLILVLAIIILLMMRRHAEKQHTENGSKEIRAVRKTLWGILVLWVMTTPYFPWDFLGKLPGFGFLVRSIQFPARLFSLLAAVCAFLAVLWMALVLQQKDDFRLREIRYLFTGLVAAELILGAFFLDDTLNTTSPIWLINRDSYAAISVGKAEYLPEGTSLWDYRYHDPVLEDGMVMEEYQTNDL